MSEVNPNLVTLEHCFEVVSHLHMTLFINWLTRSPAAGMFECFLVAGIHYELSLLFPKSSFIYGLISDDNLTMAKKFLMELRLYKATVGEKRVDVNLP